MYFLVNYQSSSWGFCSLYCGIYKLHTKKLYCTGAVARNVLSCEIWQNFHLFYRRTPDDCFWRIHTAMCFKQNMKSHAVTGRMFFFWNVVITQISIKLHFVNSLKYEDSLILSGDNVFFYYFWKEFLRISQGFFYLSEMLSGRWCHAEICLGYTKFYALEK